MKKKNLGFTLVELMVVMAIIAVLATLIIGAVSIARKSSVATVNRGNAKSLQIALEACYAATRAYPSTITADSTFAAGAAFILAATAVCPGATLTLSSGSCAGGGGKITANTGTTYTITPLQGDCGSTYMGGSDILTAN